MVHTHISKYVHLAMATCSQGPVYTVSVGKSLNRLLSTTLLTYDLVTPCANVHFNSHTDVQFHFLTEMNH